ncbi:MAG TPA: tripartite tricarboxylate transporter substrate binding protein [Xanthobacteraceae bacterium]|jgi:tripartite-type tricarboxylate transporter receptor subunit TctC|nr:tripartite tricarboxylate transporter substrate binding protein [Xanthobacteraceae bacterium]
MLFRIALTGLFLVNALFFCSPSLADDKKWPDHAIHIIAPLPAGSAADTIARLVGQKLSEKLGQTVIIDNRAGASGEIGTNEIAKAAPDGYTLGIATTTTLVTAPILSLHTRYDPVKDFAPVAMVGYSPYVLVVHPSVAAKNVKEYIALAKSKPGRITYSSVGDASLAHLAGALFGNMAGVELNQIPYKSSTQAVIDLLAGRIDSQFGILTTTHQYIKDGRLNVLGITTEKRIPEYPDIPTISESGLPGYEASLWLAVIAPAKTPPAIVERLNTVINEVMAQPDVRKTLLNQAIITDPLSPAGMRKRIEDDLSKWKDLAVKAGLKKEGKD